MSWDVINGDASLLPSSGSNEIKFESGKPKKVRLLLANNEQPYSFFQHILEVEKFENGQKTTIFRTVNCPKTRKNPYAPCKLCDGQQIRRRIRHAAPSFEYELGLSKLLAGGEQIWKPIATTAKMGVDVTAVDWAIQKTGQGRNDTGYTATSLGATPFQLPEGQVPLDPEEEYKPHTEEEMKAVVEGLGLDWDTLIVPPPIQYPASLDEALKHVIPNTKYKDQTMEQVWNTNKGMIEFFANSNRVTFEKACAQVILVALAGAQIDGAPNYANGNRPAPQPTPTPTATQPAPTQQQPVQDNAPAPQPTGLVDADKQGKINEINKMLQTNQKFVQGGYQMIIDTMKQVSGGKSSINEFTDAELDKMLEVCKQ